MKKIVRTILIFFLIIGASNRANANAEPECFDQVTVTGYYVPLLSDYDTGKTRIQVRGTPHAFTAGFLAIARIKGAGVSVDGHILTYDGKEWNLRTDPLTSAEKEWFPFERDYLARREIVSQEDGKVRTYPKAFVDEAGLEGSGKVAEDEYIGWPWDCAATDGTIAYLSEQCDAKWHSYAAALDASGRPVQLGVVATDKKYFNAARPALVTVDPKPPGFPSGTFEARDLGPAITDNRIDVFAGWGLGGLKRALALTSSTSKVCFTRGIE